MNYKMSVIGVGYAGPPLAIVFSKKHPVLGFSIDQLRIDEQSKGVDSTKETSSADLLRSGQGLNFLIELSASIT